MGEDAPEHRKARLLTLWHAYQPPGQSDYWVERIANESYRPVSRFLRDAPAGFRAAVNINGSLVEHLLLLRINDVIDNLGAAAQAGNIELTGCAAYHPLLPTLLKHGEEGVEEVVRQIEMNDTLNGRVFGSVWRPAGKKHGFFPPEMAFSPELAQYIASTGHDWAITDSIVFDAANSGISIPHTSVATVNGLPIFFRSSWSNEFSIHRPDRGDYDVERYAWDMAAGARAWFGDAGGYLTVAYDMETLGHHRKRYRRAALEKYAFALRDAGLTPTLFGDLPYGDYTPVAVKAGSWSTNAGDISYNNPFPLWDSPGNPVHAALSDLTGIAIAAVHEAKRSGAEKARPYVHARRDLDYGLRSCKEWWANPPGHWNPGNIRQGAAFLSDAATKAYEAMRLSGAAPRRNYFTEAAEANKRLEAGITQLGG